MQVPTSHVYLSQMLQMSNSSGSQISGTDEIHAKWAAKKENDQLTIESEMDL